MDCASTPRMLIVARQLFSLRAKYSLVNYVQSEEKSRPPKAALRWIAD